MDPVSIQLGLTAAGLMSTFFSESVKQLGKTTTDLGVKHLSALVDAVKKHFTNSSIGMTNIGKLEAAPTDGQIESSVAAEISSAANQDQGFRAALEEQIKTVHQTKTQVVFSNQVAANIQKMIQIMYNYGPITM